MLNQLQGRSWSVVNASGGTGLARRKVLAAQVLVCITGLEQGKIIPSFCSDPTLFSSQLLKNTSGLVIFHSWLREFGQGSSQFSFPFGIFIFKVHSKPFQQPVFTDSISVRLIGKTWPPLGEMYAKAGVCFNYLWLFQWVTWLVLLSLWMKSLTAGWIPACSGAIR